MCVMARLPQRSVCWCPGNFGVVCHMSSLALQDTLQTVEHVLLPLVCSFTQHTSSILASPDNPIDLVEA